MSLNHEGNGHSPYPDYESKEAAVNKLWHDGYPITEIAAITGFTKKFIIQTRRAWRKREEARRETQRKEEERAFKALTPRARYDFILRQAQDFEEHHPLPRKALQSRYKDNLFLSLKFRWRGILAQEIGIYTPPEEYGH